MSAYDDRPRRSHGTRTREPEYVDYEDEYVARGPATRELVIRPRDDGHDAYPVEVRRQTRYEDYGRDGRRARSTAGRYRDQDSYYDDDYYSDHSPRSKRGRPTRYDSYDDYDDYPRDRPRERRKSTVESALSGLGLGSVVAAVTGKKLGSRSPSRSRNRRGSSSDRSRRGHSRSRSRSRGGDDTKKKWQQAAKAAIIAAAIEGVRSRKIDGPWTGEKGQRVATAALGAAGIDGLIDRNADRGSKRHIVESVVGGLGVNRLANGSRDDSASRGRGRSMSRDGRGRSKSIVDRIRSRSRSVFNRGVSRSRSPDDRGRSQSRGPGLKGLIAAGGVAAAGKAIYDRVRSKSRGRLNRSRSRSVDSEDSYVPSRRPRYADRGGPPQGDYDRNDRDDDRDRGRGPNSRDDAQEFQAERSNPGGDARARGENRDRSSSKSSCSTTDLENQRKKTRLKEITTALFATVATIHAGHGVFDSMKASEKRHKAVMEGKISPEEARKMKSKNVLQDVAAVGIAALGIKSAYADWKEMNESRKSKHEIEARKRRRQKLRQQRMEERKLQLEAFAATGQYPGSPGMQQQQQQPIYGDANPYQAYSYDDRRG